MTEDDAFILAFEEQQQQWHHESWKGWNGRMNCRPPVRGWKEVEVRYRDGTTLDGFVDCLVWRSDPDNPQPIDIVAYRLLNDQPYEGKRA